MNFYKILYCHQTMCHRKKNERQTTHYTTSSIGEFYCNISCSSLRQGGLYFSNKINNLTKSNRCSARLHAGTPNKQTWDFLQSFLMIKGHLLFHHLLEVALRNISQVQPGAPNGGNQAQMPPTTTGCKQIFFWR